MYRCREQGTSSCMKCADRPPPDRRCVIYFSPQSGSRLWKGRYTCGYDSTSISIGVSYSGLNHVCLSDGIGPHVKNMITLSCTSASLVLVGLPIEDYDPSRVLRVSRNRNLTRPETRLLSILRRISESSLFLEITRSPDISPHVGIAQC
jgi:hypothetical protein